MEMLTGLIMIILSQCLCVPRHHIVLKYIQLLLVNYTLIELGLGGGRKYKYTQVYTQPSTKST